MYCNHYYTIGRGILAHVIVNSCVHESTLKYFPNTECFQMHVTVAAELLKVLVCVNSYFMTKLELNIMTKGWAFQCATHDRVNIGVITAFYGIRICFYCFSLYYLVVKGYLNVTELKLTVGIRAGLYLCFHENVTQHIKVYGMSFI